MNAVFGLYIDAYLRTRSVLWGWEVTFSLASISEEAQSEIIPIPNMCRAFFRALVRLF